MDLFALLVGIVIGLVIGFAVAWLWSSSLSKAKTSATQSTETELKTILALQAKNHLEASRSSIQTLEAELKRLQANVTEYEQSLSAPSEDYANNTFFGEHASMFLRNNDLKPKKIMVTKSTDNQPRDFANSGSGVFAGSPAVQAQSKEEKSSN